PDAAAVQGVQLADRGIPPRPQAVLRGGAVPGAACQGAAQPHRDEPARLCAPGVPLLRHRLELVACETRRYSRRRQDLLGKTKYPTPQVCVTPRTYGRRTMIDFAKSG